MQARLSSLDADAFAPPPLTESEAESVRETESDGDSWATQSEALSEIHFDELAAAEAEYTDEGKYSDVKGDTSRSDEESSETGSTLDFVSPKVDVSAVAKSHNSRSMAPSPSPSLQLDPASSDVRIAELDSEIRDLSWKWPSIDHRTSSSAASPAPSRVTLRDPALSDAQARKFSSVEFIKRRTESGIKESAASVLNVRLSPP